MGTGAIQGECSGCGHSPSLLTIGQRMNDDTAPETNAVAEPDSVPQEVTREEFGTPTADQFSRLTVDEKLEFVYRVQVATLETLTQVGEMTDYLIQGTTGVFEAAQALKAQDFSPSALIKMMMGKGA